MPDEDELEAEDGGGLEELVNDALLTDVLMGWDGDPCKCRACVCPRFRDDAESQWCRQCASGNHQGPLRP